MKKPRMPNKQMNSTENESTTEKENRQEDRDTLVSHQWSEETIVVNGQAMTVTFPLESE